jgi:hypothetical protein
MLRMGSGIRDANSDRIPKGYSLRTFILPSLTVSDEYSYQVVTKCFSLSMHLGPPMFFLTFTMNLFWVGYQTLKRDRGTTFDSVMSAIVFKAKLSALIKFIKDHGILEKVSGFAWRTEHQK